MENFAFILPDSFADFEKNPENVYAVKGIGKAYSKQDFKEFTEQFTKNISRDPSSIMEADFYEPAFYLMKNYTRDPAFNKILEKVVLTIGANFHKVLNTISDNINLDDESVQCFLRFMVILLNFLDKSIVSKSEEDILDEEGEIKKRKKRENEGHNLTDLVKTVILKFRELCYGVIFRELLRKSAGLGRLLYKAVKQVFKDEIAIFNEKTDQEHSTAIHVFQIMEELLELEVIKTYNLQYDLAMLINDVETASKTVGGFVILCSRSKKAKIFELASSTIVFVIKKHCMGKSKVASESNSVRNFKQFFEYLAPILSDIFHNHFQDCLFLYDSQCHPLRSAMTEIVKHIIINKCGQFEDSEKDEELGSNNEALRKELLDWIIQRLRDKSSWCRNKAIGDLDELMTLKMIQTDYIHKIFEKAALHIRDPTSIVRKKAMILASEIITYYIQTMNFPEEEIIEPELEDLRIRKAEAEKRYEENPEDREAINEMMSTALKYESLLLLYKKTYQILAGLVPQVVSLMFRSSGDSLEAIRLLVKMKNLGYNKVDAHFPKMYTLIWSEDKDITNEIKASFVNLYVNKERKQNACKNICNLLKMCDKSTKVCVLRVIKILFEDSEKNKKLDAKSKLKHTLEEEYIPLFWTYFQERFENARSASEEEDYRLALKIIAEGLYYYPKWFYSIKKQDVIYLMKLYITRVKRVVDWEVIADICRIMSKTKSHFDNNESTHVLILKSIEEIISLNQGVTDLGWYTATQAFTQAVFDVSKCPEIYIEIFIKKISAFLMNSSDSSFEVKIIKLNQLIWISGEIALKLLIRIEDIDELLKKRKTVESNQTNRQGGVEEPEELDQAMGGFDSVYQNQRDILHEISENQILYDNILGTILPVVRAVVEKIARNKGDLSSSFLNTTLAHTCIITLFKFASVSYKFCNENIGMLIELISKDVDPALVIKSLMGLSDLIKRFPQVVEPFSQRLFETLDSKHKNVKKVSMIIITHLILNDMLKIKGEIVDIIMKLADEDIEIRKFTELFMMQLHKKDPMIINNLLPDALTRFSTIDFVTPELFERFAQNLLGFIDKERQASALGENLIQRFKNKENTKEIVFTSICLNIISNNLSILRVLEVNVDLYLDRLHEKEIKKNFKEMLEKLKNAAKNNKKKNLVSQVEALEEKLRPFMEIVMGDERTTRRNEGINNTARKGTIEEAFQRQASEVGGEGENTQSVAQDRTARRKEIIAATGGKQGKRAGNRMDEEEDSMSQAIAVKRTQIVREDEENHSMPLPPPPSRIANEESGRRPKTRGKKGKAAKPEKPNKPKKKRVMESDDEDDEDEEPALQDDDEDEDYTN